MQSAQDDFHRQANLTCWKMLLKCSRRMKQRGVMMNIDGHQQRRAFTVWLRTGRLPTQGGDGVELKFNPWHDPEDGQFTHAGAGRYFGPNDARSTVRRADGGPKASAREKRVAQTPRTPLRKVAEFADGVVDGVYDVGKQTAAGLYDAATTNPVTTIRNFGEGVARTIDGAIAAEDTPARVQVRRAAHTVANASAHDLGYATGQVVGNAALAAVPGAAATKISSVRRLATARPRATYHPPEITWPKENFMKQGAEHAKLYNDSAPGARPGYAPAITRTLPDGTLREVKFDGIDGDYPIDRKWSIRRNQKAKDQALRQSAALSEQKLIAVWEPPSTKMRREAILFLNSLNIKNIKTRVVEP